MRVFVCLFAATVMTLVLQVSHANDSHTHTHIQIKTHFGPLLTCK